MTNTHYTLQEKESLTFHNYQSTFVLHQMKEVDLNNQSKSLNRSVEIIKEIKSN
jgi:hypothetical protein